LADTAAAAEGEVVESVAHGLGGVAVGRQLVPAADPARRGDGGGFCDAHEVEVDRLEAALPVQALRVRQVSGRRLGHGITLHPGPRSCVSLARATTLDVLRELSAQLGDPLGAAGVVAFLGCPERPTEGHLRTSGDRAVLAAGAPQHVYPIAAGPPEDLSDRMAGRSRRPQ